LKWLNKYVRFAAAVLLERPMRRTASSIVASLVPTPAAIAIVAAATRQKMKRSNKEEEIGDVSW